MWIGHVSLGSELLNIHFPPFLESTFCWTPASRRKLQWLQSLMSLYDRMLSTRSTCGSRRRIEGWFEEMWVLHGNEWCRACLLISIIRLFSMQQLSEQRSSQTLQGYSTHCFLFSGFKSSFWRIFTVQFSNIGLLCNGFHKGGQTQGFS